MAMKPGSSLIGQGNEAVATCEGESESDELNDVGLGTWKLAVKQKR
jgi:hypothetical protein